MFFPGRLPCLLAAALLMGASTARASDLIPNEPTTKRSATVMQPHVTAELIAESTAWTPGHPIDVALHLHMDSGWHTYWINPGDAGLATEIKWTLPTGWSAGPLQFPTPEVHMMGPLTTYGYAGDVYLLTQITPPKMEAQGEAPRLKAHATWLVCQEECIPGKADLDVGVGWSSQSGKIDPVEQVFFAAAKARLPMPGTDYAVRAWYRGNQIDFDITPAVTNGPIVPPGDLYFFAEQPNVLDTKSVMLQPDGTESSREFRGHLNLVQNGEKPDHLSGVLSSDQRFVPAIQNPAAGGDAYALSIPPFPVDGVPAAATPGAVSMTGAVLPAPLKRAPAASDGAPPSDGRRQMDSTAAAPFLPAMLAAAFVGGLILNLMPCVLPVLSLKVFSLIRHAGEDAHGAWKQGVAFTAGVIVSFWILAGLLIALESAGRHLGWGFQMQSPGFVLALIFLFFLLGLNLLGVFEIGASLVGLDARVASGLGGPTSSFANGALATLAATPCTAPFMGSAVGFAAEQPAAISLLVFTFLALGMAAPYLALTTFPGALKLIPRPGAWMETLKQFMGFLLMGTVIFLVYVFGALTGSDSVPMLLGALLLAAVAAWIFGRGTGPAKSLSSRVVASILALLLLAAAIGEGVHLTFAQPTELMAPSPDVWQPWSPEAVRQALAQGRPVFVDFTAAWCLSCKVNERVALDVPSTQNLFSAKHVVLLRGDWTHSDPRISDTLRRFHRDGVPLYLVYSPRSPDAPDVLPEILTPGLVQDALQKLP